MDAQPYQAVDNSISAHSYADAVSHYTSPKRHDRVKIDWEEPFSIEVYKRVLSSLGSPKTVSVLDVGCGTGDGLRLMSRAQNSSLGYGQSILTYVGLDNSHDMINQARSAHRENPNATFIEQDVRLGAPLNPFDVYLSCGVPYSHLTPEELLQALFNIFSAIRRNQSRSAVVVDVLGRYSIEWTNMWPHERWSYRMSFFSTDLSMGSAEMSVYSAASLSRIFKKAAFEAGVDFEALQFFDRSIAVGRHTMTGEYNKNLEPIRILVNELYARKQFDLARLEIKAVPTIDCSATENFHLNFRASWNANIRAAQDLISNVPMQRIVDKTGKAPLLLSRIGPSGLENKEDILPLLADTLRILERDNQPGLGVGHSLIGVAIVDGRRH